jgi:hypothetical protein
VSIPDIALEPKDLNFPVLPDGEYPALWSGYSVDLNSTPGGLIYRFHSPVAVKGFNVHCEICVKSGKVTLTPRTSISR